MAVIDLQNLSKRYGTAMGIKDVTMKVDEGEIFGFVGPNGAGKSTTIRCMMGLIMPSGGSMKILGESGQDGLTKARADIGYLPGEAFFYNDMTAQELLEYSANLRKCGRDSIKPMAERLDLDLNKKIGQLSLGNRKKVGVIAALMHKPKLVILDEPTSGLDPVMQHVFFDLITDANREGATVLLSSHNLAEVEAVCKRVAVIKTGSIVACGTVQEICGSKLKEVKLSFTDAQSVVVPDFSGVANCKTDGNNIVFDYTGEPLALVKALSAYKLDDVQISNADLERVIMHYYL